MERAMSNNSTLSFLSASELCHALSDASPFPTAMIVGAQHVVRYANPAFCRLVGEPEESVLGMFAADCLPQCPGCIALLTHVNRTGEPKSHTERGTSLVKPLSWSYSVWPVLAQEGQPLGAILQVTEASELQSESTAMNEALMVSAVRQHELAAAADVLTAGMGHEIARRKESEEALASSEAKLRLALESARANTWEWNVKANTLQWSNEIPALPVIEKSRETAFETWRSMVYPEDHSAWDSLQEQAENCSSRIAVEFRVQDGGGAVHWMLLRGSLDGVEGGRVVSYTGIFLDVTERKQTERALLQSEKLAAVGRLAASIAHEINNPLESVTNLLYLARASTDYTETQSYLETAERELRRVSAISNQTLRFYKQSTNPTCVTCEELIEATLSIYQGRLVNSMVEIEKRKRATKPVLCFEGEIRQVLSNLIGNAIDAMHSGGRLRLRSREATDFKTGRRGLVLTVADTGGGIDPELLIKIFEPFFTTKGIGGTGLGLWVSKEIVVRHDGVLRVRSSQRMGHAGTVFTLFLPFDAVLRIV